MSFEDISLLYRYNLRLFLAFQKTSNDPLHPPLATFRTQPTNSIRSVCKRIVSWVAVANPIEQL